jgi:MFS family permease
MPQEHLRLLASLRDLPRMFWRFVGAVGVFGLGNFAHTLLVLRAVSLLTPRYGAVVAGRFGIALYILHNVLYAAVSYPAGALGDRVNKRTLLCAGYAMFGVMCLLFLTNPTSVPMLALLFILAGVYVGIVDAVHRALAADLLPIHQRSVGYGALATANSFGDLLSSVVVGLLWAHVSIAAGFAYAAVLTLAGAFMLLLVPARGVR